MEGVITTFRTNPWFPPRSSVRSGLSCHKLSLIARRVASAVLLSYRVFFLFNCFHRKWGIFFFRGVIFDRHDQFSMMHWFLVCRVLFHFRHRSRKGCVLGPEKLNSHTKWSPLAFAFIISMVVSIRASLQTLSVRSKDEGWKPICSFQHPYPGMVFRSHFTYYYSEWHGKSHPSSRRWFQIWREGYT